MWPNHLWPLRRNPSLSIPLRLTGPVKFDYSQRTITQPHNQAQDYFSKLWVPWAKMGRCVDMEMRSESDEPLSDVIWGLGWQWCSDPSPRPMSVSFFLSW